MSSYTLEISPAPPAGPASVTSATTSYTFSGLRNGTAYSVRVRAHNRAPEPSAWSASSQPMVPARAPDAPEVTATPTDSTLGRVIAITWTAPADNGDAVAQYEVVVDGPNGGTFPQAAGTQQMTFEQAQTKYPYRVSVRARNKVGWGEAGTTTASTFGLPTAPTSVTATPVVGAGRIDLRWSGADDNGTPIQAYVIRLPDGGELDVGNRTSYTFENLTGGATYTYQVRSVNGAGSSGWSAAASARATTAPRSAGRLGRRDRQRDGRAAHRDHDHPERRLRRWWWRGDVHVGADAATAVTGWPGRSPAARSPWTSRAGTCPSEAHG